MAGAANAAPAIAASVYNGAGLQPCPSTTVPVYNGGRHNNDACS